LTVITLEVGPMKKESHRTGLGRGSSTKDLRNHDLEKEFALKKSDRMLDSRTDGFVIGKEDRWRKGRKGREDTSTRGEQKPRKASREKNDWRKLGVHK